MKPSCEARMDSQDVWILLGFLLLCLSCVNTQDTDCGGMSPAESEARCKSANRPGMQACDGHGDCMCGMCACQPVHPMDPSLRYSGEFCECNDYSCDFYEGQICGGPERGRCMCGECNCRPEFVGTACDCPISSETCRSRDGMVCNNHGTCQCGQCRCEQFYAGRYCGDCPTCPGSCERLRPCAMCGAFGTGTLNQEECHLQCSNNVQLVEQVADDDSGDIRTCVFVDDSDGCRFTFTYDALDNIKVGRTKECGSGAGGSGAGITMSLATYTYILLGTAIMLWNNIYTL